MEVQETGQPQPTMVGGMTENTWAMLTHLAGLVGVLIPFGNILGPLVVWMTQKDKMPSIDRHGKALSFRLLGAIDVEVTPELLPEGSPYLVR